MQAKQIINQLRNDYPRFVFLAGENFLFHSSEQQIFYIPDGEAIFLIHELAHALLQHHDYKFDIELLKIESEAWDLTKELANKYKLDITENEINDAIDSYREWLDTRSRCPKCNSIGFQKKTGVYCCLECQSEWRPNSAKQNFLRRKLIK
ncbi:MAG: hypothetical protein Q3996_02385 [Candidatus Saccharibacteria bacterium]|nr:hypothetical protein [Candidatus Saccharibacteria bacterium]